MKARNKTIVDTNVVIGLFAGEPWAATALESKQVLLLPVIVVGELYFGAMRSSRPESNLTRLKEFTQNVAVLNCDPETARVYGAVRAKLANKGTPIPANDSWIAALAIQHSAIVLTRDSHFNEVEGLEVDFLR